MGLFIGKKFTSIVDRRFQAMKILKVSEPMHLDTP